MAPQKAFLEVRDDADRRGRPIPKNLFFALMYNAPATS
jgi:hypothetical protein